MPNLPWRERARQHPARLVRAEGMGMCLAVPMRIVSISGHTALCEARGVRRDVSLTLLDGEAIAISDHVLVHVGYALQTITAAYARDAWALFDQIAETMDGAQPAHEHA